VPSPRPPRRLRALLVTAGLSASVAAGCSSPVKAEYSPDAARSIVQKTLNPPPAQLDCLKAKFEAEPDIAAIFNVGERADDEERTGYVRAIRACIPIEEFASLVATTAFGTDQPGAATTSGCVREAIVRLPTNQQDLLYLYFSNPGAVNALDVGPTTKAITAACGLDDADVGDGPTGTLPLGSTPP
jgi:hypothetical protein